MIAPPRSDALSKLHQAMPPPTRPPEGSFISVHSALLRRRLFNSASGIALLWAGWVVLVFQIALWFTTIDAEPDARRWEALVIMVLLSQSAIVTGVGLAVLETRSGKEKGQNHDAPQTPAAVTRKRASPVAMHQVTTRQSPTVQVTHARAARLFSDGSIEIETKLGRRRFTNTGDAIKFVGPGVPAQTAMH